MQELSFINVKHPHGLFCIPVTYHDNISKDIQVTEAQNHS